MQLYIEQIIRQVYYAGKPPERALCGEFATL